MLGFLMRQFVIIRSYQTKLILVSSEDLNGEYEAEGIKV